jgi:hypothetical protein
MEEITMKKYTYIITMAALLMASCDNEVGNPSQPSVDPNEIRVEAAIGGTRVTGTTFDAGDTFSLFAVEYNDNDEVAQLQPAGNYLNNEAMCFDGTEWRGARTLYWSEKPCDFYGIYPYQDIVSVEDVLFEIATDQSTPRTEETLGGYEASDIMWAKSERVTREEGAVSLQFEHMMSRLVVNIERGPSYEGELPEEIDVHIYNTATTALVNWKIGSLEKYQNSPSKTIKMRRVDGDTFDAIVVPQFIERSTPLVEVTMEGIAYLLEYEMSFRPGMQHTITVTLNTSPDQEKIEINIDGDITEW